MAQSSFISGSLLTEREASDMLKVDITTMRRWRRDGRGPAHIRIGRLVRYRPEAVERFLSAADGREAV